MTSNVCIVLSLHKKKFNLVTFSKEYCEEKQTEHAKNVLDNTLDRMNKLETNNRANFSFILSNFFLVYIVTTTFFHQINISLTFSVS